jgi:hypothetical protein
VIQIEDETMQKIPLLRIAPVALVLLLTSPIAAAQGGDEAIHNELRTLRDGMLDAWDRRDIDGLLAYVDPGVVVTWQNGEVNRGHDEIRAFYDEVLGGEESIIESIDSTLEMTELSILHSAESAVAYGMLHDRMAFASSVPGAAFIGAGTEIELDSHWTAALALKDGRWQVTALHVSTNMFSNPVLSLAISATRWIAGVLGLLLGVGLTVIGARLLGRLAKGRSAA